MGFGNVRAQLFLPPLTSVSQELALIGRQAASLAFERLEGRRFDPGYEEKIPARLVIRESTGPAADL
jgi:DNA-binding LacI/PurR family transcriptional regulator